MINKKENEQLFRSAVVFTGRICGSEDDGGDS